MAFAPPSYPPPPPPSVGTTSPQVAARPQYHHHERPSQPFPYSNSYPPNNDPTKLHPNTHTSIPSYSSSNSNSSTGSLTTTTTTRQHFTTTSIIDPTTLNEEQKKIFNKLFDSRKIDLEGPEIGWMELVKMGIRGERGWGEVGRELMKWKNLRGILILVIVIVIIVLTLHYDDDIVNAMEPFGRHLKSMTLGWLIPVAILFVLSFPPLFGAEIINVLLGVIWGLWIGWGIASLGVFLGEIVNFFLFLILSRRRRTKWENKSFYWAKLSETCRVGGLEMVILIKYSVIPTHISTAVFAASGVGFWPFLIGTIVSLPRWIPHVNAGVYLKEKGNHDLSKSTKISFIALMIATVVVTIFCMRRVNGAIEQNTNKVRTELLRRRAEMLNQAAGSRSSSSSTNARLLKTGVEP